MRVVGFAVRASALAAVCGAAALFSGPVPGANAGGSGTVAFSATVKRAATNAPDFTVQVNAQAITTLANCYADPTIIASGSGASVTFGGSTLTDSSKSFGANALAGKPVAVSGQLLQSGFAPTYTLTTITDASAAYAVNLLAGLKVVAKDVRGATGVTYTSTVITDNSKALVPNSLNGLGVLAQWGGFSTSFGTVQSNTATTITLTVAGWVGNGTPAAGATYTVSTLAQSAGVIVSNTATVITIAGVWSPSTPNNHVSYSIDVPAAKITNSGGAVTYTRRDTGSSGTTYAAMTLTDSSKTWAANEFAAAIVTSGANTAMVASNTGTALTLSAAWSPATPSANDAYVISGSMDDSSQSFGASAFTGLSIVSVLPASSGGGANVSYGSIANPTGANVTYTTTTLTDTTLPAPFPAGGLNGKTVFLGGGSISGVVASNTTSVITLTAAGWTSPPFNGFPYAISWLKDTTANVFTGKNFAGRTVISGSSKATVFSNTNNELALQTAWSPSTPAATAAYTVTPQAEEAVVSTNTATRLSLSSGWSPFAPTAGVPYYLLLSTINASIASNTGAVITTTAPWSPAVPSSGSSYNIANSQPISTCGIGSFTTTVSFDPGTLQFVSATSDTFLTSTGRPLFGTCAPTTGSGTVTFSCTTTGTTPLGPVGTGSLFSLKLKPLGLVNTTTPLTQTTTIADIQGDAIAHTDASMTINFSRCADVSGNGNVSLADVLQVLGFVGKTSTNDGNWITNQKYDLNQNLSISLADVLYALDEVGQFCAFIP